MAVAVAAVAPGASSAAIRDLTAPRASLAYAELLNQPSQYAAGAKLFYNPRSAGTFSILVSASDAESGVASVTFPTAWGQAARTDVAAPFRQTYAWPTGAVQPTARSIVVKNKAGLTVSLPFTVVADSTAPAAGASVTHPVGVTTATSTSVSFAGGTGDTGSGLSLRTLRRVAASAAEACVGGVTTPVTTTTSPYVDSTLLRGKCYSYQMYESDRVGNVRVTPGPGTLKVNTAPVALAGAVSTPEDTRAAVTLAGTDADRNPLTYRVVTAPTHGTLVGTAPNYTYVPHAHYFGADTATFTVSDGLATSAPAAVRLTVGPVNDAPVARAFSATSAENSSVGTTLSATDVEGQAITFAVATPPVHGRLSGTGSALTYTPNADYAGTDSFTYTGSDGLDRSAPATVSLTVTAVNGAPSAAAVNASTDAGTPVSITLSGVDPDGDALTYGVVAAPANGTLSGTAPDLTYTPRAGFSGTDTFTYTARDATTISAAATATVVVRPGSTGGMAFKASGMHGAGFQNAVAVDPRGTGVMLSAADVSGMHRSTDWGRTWVTSNAGLGNSSQLHVATVAFSPRTPDTAYAGVGHRGAGGGFLASIDGGRNWSLRSSVPQFSGSNNKGTVGLPDTHPRSTGNLLAFDSARSLIYAATFNDGVMRSADDGRTWTTLGLAGKHLRSIAIDAANPNLVYASTYGDGVYKTSTGSTTGTFTKLATSPVRAEELLVLGGKVYSASGAAGVHVSTDAGATWRQLGAGVVRSDGPAWISLTGYADSAGRHVLVVGADKPSKGASGNFDSLMRSLDGGVTWASLTADQSRIRNEVGGPPGEAWWLLARMSSMALGEGSYTAAHITVLGSRMFVAGRSGIWGSSDAGATWYPMVRGMQVTINKQVIADPNVAGRVYIANTDWVNLYSTDGGRTVVQNRPPVGVMSLALALDTTKTPSVLYSSVGMRDTNTGGEIYSNADPVTNKPWVSLGFNAATGGKRAVAVAVREVAGSPVVLAAAQGGGVWRKAGTTWTKVSSLAMTSEANKFGSLSWPAGSSTAYLHDHASGVWRSSDNGLTWAKVWAKPGAPSITTSIAAHPTVPGTAFVSVSDGVYRLDGVSTGTVGAGGTATKLTGIARPGPVAVDTTGRLLVAEPGNATASASLKRSADRGATWTSLGDAAYRGGAGFPFALAAGPGGTAYLALNGNGVMHGNPQ